MERPTTPHDRLQKKLNKKKEQRSKGTSESKTDKTGKLVDNEDQDPDIFQMISQVQNILRTNPEMVAKVSNCVNSLMSNPDIMNQLSSQIENVQSQTLQTSASGVEAAADSKKS